VTSRGGGKERVCETLERKKEGSQLNYPPKQSVKSNRKKPKRLHTSMVEGKRYLNEGNGRDV